MLATYSSLNPKLEKVNMHVKLIGYAHDRSIALLVYRKVK